MVLLDSLTIFEEVGALYKALYRKWRPNTFDDVCGQEHITSILKYQCEQGKHSHAYLFCGTRGTGKTSCSKILAKAINCLSPVNGNPCGKCASCLAIDNGSSMDVIEMDAASNNGIDDIRDIRDEVVYTPSELKYKVYIIDEVHMLSINAFNGLLKTLEEPPSYVVFILATTEMHKLPTTIVSRCQRYDFRKLSSDTIIGRLKYIAQNEGVEITDDAARIIARLASGGMRDAISLFELCCGCNRKIDTELVGEMLGISGTEILHSLVCAVKAKDYARIFETVAEIENSSKDISVFWQDLIGYYRDMLVSKTLKDSAAYLELSDSENAQLKELVCDMTASEIIRQSKILDNALSVMQRAGSYKRNVAEMTLVRLCDTSLDNSAEALTSRINELESRVMKLNGMLSDIYENGVTAKAAPDEKHSGNGASAVIENTPEHTASYVQANSELKNSAAKNAPNAEKEPDFVPGGTDVTRTKLKFWEEVVESVRNSIPSTKGFIDNSDAYISADGEYTIILASDMAVKMLSREKTRNVIADAISFYAQKRVSDAQLNFKFEESQKNKSLPIDELI